MSQPWMELDCELCWVLDWVRDLGRDWVLGWEPCLTYWGPYLGRVMGLWSERSFDRRIHWGPRRRGLWISVRVFLMGRVKEHVKGHVWGPGLIESDESDEMRRRRDHRRI